LFHWNRSVKSNEIPNVNILFVCLLVGRQNSASGLICE
jgi:hypothetical protein